MTIAHLDPVLEPRKKTTRAVVVALSVAILSGCTSGGAVDASQLDWGSAADVVWSSEDALLSAMVVVDGVAAGYVDAGDGRAAVVARDALSGDELWRLPSIPGTNSPGVAHSLLTTEFEQRSVAAFLAPSSTAQPLVWGTLALIDLRSGESVAPQLESTPIRSARPATCAETVCVSGRFEGDESTRVLRVEGGDPPMLTATPAEGVPYLEDGRFLGEFVSSTYRGDTEVLNYGENGGVVWSRPYVEVFGEGTSSNGGWNWPTSGDEPLIGLGYPYVERDFSQPFEFQVFLDESRMVRLDPETGETLWALDGVTGCTATGGSTTLIDGVIVTCRVNSGVQSGFWNGTEVARTEYSNIDVDLVGIDAESGDIRWEVALGDEIANIARVSDGGRGFAQGDIPIPVIDGVAHTVDPATGEATPIPADAVLLCQVEAQETSLIGAWNEGVPADYRRASAYSLCTPDARIVRDGIVSHAALSAAGFDTSDVVVVNLTTGVTAFAPRN